VSETLRFSGYSRTLMDEMDAICGWLRDNGIVPEDVPVDARVTLDEGTMTIDVYLKRDGHLVIEDGEVARGTITVPLVRRPPVLASLGPARRKHGTS
jgi:hypothetical protein